MKMEWVVDAMHSVWSRFPRKEPYSNDCRVVVDGGPEFADISTLTIDDIESIEIYNSFPNSPTTVAATGRAAAKFIKLSNAREALFENQTRVCPAVYVWTR